MRLRRLLASVLAAVMALPAVPAHAGSLDEMERALQALQGQMESLRKEIQQMKQTPPAAAPAATSPPTAPAAATPAPGVPPVATTTTTTTVASAPRDTQSGVQVIPDSVRPTWLTDFRLGGYGSVRFEAADTPNVGETFTYRRFVLAGDATIAERLRTVFGASIAWSGGWRTRCSRRPWRPVSPP